MRRSIAKLWYIFDRRSRLRAAATLTLMLASSALEVAGIGLVLPLLRLISDPNGIEAMPILARIKEGLGIVEGSTFLIVLCAGMFAVYVLKNSVVAATIWSQQRLIWGLRAELASALVARYVASPYSFHLQRNSATLLRNATSSVGDVIAGLLFPALMIANEVLVASAITLLLLSLEPTVTIVAGAVLGAAIALNHMLLRGRFRRWGSFNQETQREMIQRVQQALGGIKEIKVLGRERYFVDAFDASARLNARIRERLNVLIQLPRLGLEILAVGAILLTIGLAASLEGRMTEIVPMLGLFAAAAIRLMPSVARIAAQLGSVKFADAALDAIYTDLSQLRLACEADEAPPRPVDAPLIRREIELADLRFRYPGAETDALCGVSCVIRRGQSIGLVGPSGAGKTTLVDLLLGVLAPDSGRILIDGDDVAQDALHFRTRVGYVPQDVFIIDDTLRRNVALGVSDSQIDEGKIARAIRRSRLDELVARLPGGLETVLGERGVRFSGGERQRVGIARALYHEADLLVMDEATSSLDAETESEIADAIERLRGEKTLIIIAHRLSTVRHCDRLFFLSGGRIADSGTFAELAGRNAAFRRMVQMMDDDLAAASHTERLKAR